MHLVANRTTFAVACAIIALSAAPMVGCTLISGADDLEIKNAVEQQNETTSKSPNLPSSSKTGGASASTGSDGSSASSTSTGTGNNNGNGNTGDGNGNGNGNGTGTTVPKPSSPAVSLECDGYICGIGQHCCQVGNARGACVDANGTCGGVRISCEHDTCATGEVCCAFAVHKLAACVKASECVAPGTERLCHEDGDCAVGKTCTSNSEALHHEVCE